MRQRDLKRFIKDLNTLRNQFCALNLPTVELFHRQDNSYEIRDIIYSYGLISDGIWGCIKAANRVLYDDPMWGVTHEDVDYSDTGTDRGPQDLRDDWPHAISMLGEA